MNRQIPSDRLLRRTPVMGVGGVTLLMLVTMVLTTSPAFGRGSELGIAGGRAEFTSERVQAPDGAGHKIGGRKVAAPRQVRPSGQGLALVENRLKAAAASANSAVLPSVECPIWAPDDMVRVSLLNLPPPLA
jgi:hypothetical protein